MIRGKKINLRTVREKDLDELLELKSEVGNRSEFWHVMFPSEAAFKKGYRETGFWNANSRTMLITDKNDTILGEIACFKGVWYLPGYEIGYQIFNDEHKGNGYVTEALKIFSAYLFELESIQRLQLQIDVENGASKRVAEKCGYKYEGCRRKAVFTRGKYYDLDQYSLIREECPSLSQLL